MVSIIEPEAKRSFIPKNRSKQIFAASASTFFPFENVTLSFIIKVHVLASSEDSHELAIHGSIVASSAIFTKHSPTP